MMDTRDIKPDPCDARLIRFSNCLQVRRVGFRY
jgi:hypothetical protein